MKKEKDWYEKNIEEGIRDLVKVLRDNGINTTWSCHHTMVIEAENYSDGEIKEVYDLLIESGYDDFRITMIYYQYPDNYLQRHLHIKLLSKCRRKDE